jgi:hypothetical protein
MDGVLWLIAAAVYSLFQSRGIWGDRRRLIETWLRNLLGIAVGVRYLVQAGLVTTEMIHQGISSEVLVLLASTTFGLGVASLLCLYRKIFWFGTAVAVTLRSLPLGITLITQLSAVGDEWLLLTMVAINEIVVPSAILALMLTYYLGYVRVAK